jgi:hypothetical protein
MVIVLKIRKLEVYAKIRGGISMDISHLSTLFLLLEKFRQKEISTIKKSQK